MKNTETANVVNAATESTNKTVLNNVVNRLIAEGAEVVVGIPAKKTAKPVVKKPTAKKTAKPTAKKAAKPVAKKTAKPAATIERKTSLFSLTAKAKIEDLGEGQRTAIAKVLKAKGAVVRTVLIAALPDIPPASISWHLSKMIGAGLAKKTAQK